MRKMKMQRQTSFLSVLAFAAFAALPWPIAAQAQERAGQVIRFVVAFAPGGGTDITARAIAQQMSEAGLIVVVENRPGAAGVIAARQVLAAEPDGTNVLVASNPLLINQVLRPD